MSLLGFYKLPYNILILSYTALWPYASRLTRLVLRMLYIYTWSITNLGQEASLDEAVAATNGLIDWVLEQYMEWLERGGAAGLVGLQLNLKRS